MNAAEAWAAAWQGIACEIEGLKLKEAHAILISKAQDMLPFKVEGGWS